MHWISKKKPLTETTYTLSGRLPHLALLSDLHGRDPQQVIDSLCARRPSLICVAGDIIYGAQPENDCSPLMTQKDVLPFLAASSAIAPTFVSIGNHEWMLDEEDLRVLSSTGVTVLDNRFVRRTVDGVDCVLGGLTSSYAVRYRQLRNTQSACRYPRIKKQDGKRRKEKAPPLLDTAWLDAFSAAPGYHILLCHQPEYIDVVPASVELMLSGHAHGGQWRFYHPFKKAWCGVYAPGQGFFPQLTAGVHAIGEGRGRLIISRGLSNTSSVPRICNDPEIVYIQGEKAP